MQLGKRAKFKQGLKIECLLHAVMYGPDSMRMAKYKYIPLPHLNFTVHSRPMRGACSFLPFGDSIHPCLNLIHSHTYVHILTYTCVHVYTCLTKYY